jgi:hypothetical protein
MDTQMRQIIHILLIALGVVLIVGGITLAKPAASIIGLIVAAINFNSLEKISSQAPSGKKVK